MTERTGTFRKTGEVGPFFIYCSDPDGPAGLKDRTGRWVVHPDLGFRSFSDYDDGLMVAFKSHDDGYGWTLIDYHGNVISDRYNYIQSNGEGFFRVEKGAKQNVMRRDGSLVLKEWPHRVGRIFNGYFVIGKTLRKTKTTPTRYLHGIAHISGIVVLPLARNNIMHEGEGAQFQITEENGETMLTISGALITPHGTHYPKRGFGGMVGEFMEEFMQWTLPGLQFYYRDTDAPIDVEKMYPLGKVFRTGFYATVSTLLQRPVHKTRFLIASAHVALLCSDSEGHRNAEGLRYSPRAEEWRQGLLHRNSWMKVIDVYRTPEVTQILLLQIPESGYKIPAASEALAQFIQGHVGNGINIVELARRSLDEKLGMEVHPRSRDHDLMELMHRLPGFDDVGNPYPIEADNLYWHDLYRSDDEEMQKQRELSWFVHKHALDIDIVRDIDGFAWRGINATICEGCMYAKGTNDQPFGCGRLFTRSFRKAYVSGRCSFWKYCFPSPSAFESIP